MITHDYLLSRLNYDPDTGIFRWKTHRNSNLIGTIAGTKLKDGRWQIQIGNQFYKAHRLAWLYVYRHWPSDQLDHLDRNPLNNSITNLREVNQHQNMQNRFEPSKRNTSGYIGVSWDTSRQKYSARIRVDGKYLYLGRFDSAEEASIVYLEAKKKYHPFYNETNV